MRTSKLYVRLNSVLEVPLCTLEPVTCLNHDHAAMSLNLFQDLRQAMEVCRQINIHGRHYFSPGEVKCIFYGFPFAQPNR